MPAVRNVSTAARASHSLPIPLSFPPIPSVQDTVLNDPNGVSGLMRQVWKTFKDHKICLHFKADVQELVVFVWQVQSSTWVSCFTDKIIGCVMRSLGTVWPRMSGWSTESIMILNIQAVFVQRVLPEAQSALCSSCRYFIILDHVLMVPGLATMAYPCRARIAAPEPEATWEDFTQDDAVDLSEVEQILLTTNSSSPVHPALTPTAAHQH
ncbi:hypothetical protein C8J56DRAFT_1054842 [Mycena floridula]|nr:hypothetical protein C8J56DRAFT_1054842 [Mycena floridula]